MVQQDDTGRGGQSRAAVYLRISKDRGQQQAGVGRQRDDCVELCAARGYRIAGEYVDNDRSAFDMSKRRPEFERLLADVAGGLVDVIVVYHTDRLYRRLRDLVPLLEVCEKTGCQINACQAGDVDLSTAAGRTIASILGAVAEGESARMAERIRRQKQSAALAGQSNGGPRSFGFTSGKQIVESEAEVIREMVAGLSAGDSLNSWAARLQERGVKTTRGGVWSASTIRALVTSAAISGQRETGGTASRPGRIVADAVWEPIVSKADTARMRLLFSGRRANMRTGKYLLTGILLCGKCGAPMKSAAAHRPDRPRYGCVKTVGRVGACGSLYVVMQPVEELVRDAVALYLYPGPDHRLQVPATNTEKPPTAGAVEGRICKVRAELKALAKQYFMDQIGDDEWTVQRSALEAEMQTLQNTPALAPSRPLGNVPQTIGRFLTEWDSWPLGARRDIIRAVCRSITIMPRASARQAPRFDPNRVRIVWQDQAPSLE